jgi:molybdate transport system substrate-binding protein
MIKSQKDGAVLSLFIVLISFLASASTVRAEELYVAAAADLVYAFQKMERPIGDAYGLKIKWIFGSSGILSTQIEAGLPVDAFASASPEWVDRLEGKRLVAQRKVFALGRIALCTQKQSKIAVDKIENLIDPRVGKIAIANPAHAPYGIAAKEALEKVGIGEKIKSKIIYGENVLDTQTFIRRGEVDAGIIALSLTDVPEMRCTVLRPDLHKPIRQTIAILKESKKTELAQRFVDFLGGKQGLSILEKYGFVCP